MVRKDPKQFTTIEVKRNDFKKLSRYKIHERQPSWEVIKMLIDNKEAKENGKTTK